jgi:hypothetical protein
LTNTHTVERSTGILPFVLIPQGLGCARPGRPGVYSRVSAVFDWIQTQVCTYSENPPPSCNVNRVESGKRRIRLDVQYGPDPGKVSWSIDNNDEDEVAASEAGSVTDSILTSDYVDLEPGDYAFNSKHLDGGGECDCRIDRTSPLDKALISFARLFDDRRVPRLRPAGGWRATAFDEGGQKYRLCSKY